MLKKINPTKTKAWAKLADHFKDIHHKHMVDMFNKDSKRADNFSIVFNEILIDYSKNRINSETKKLLLELA